MMIGGRPDLAPIRLICVVRHKCNAKLAFRRLNASIRNAVGDDKTLASVFKVSDCLLHTSKISYKRILTKIVIIKKLPLVKTLLFLDS